MNVEQLQNWVILGGGNAYVEDLPPKDLCNYPLPPSENGKYYIMTLIPYRKRMTAKVVFYKDERRLCAIRCNLISNDGLGTTLQRGLGYDEILEAIFGENYDETT